MRHTQCLLAPARALHRLLLLELANTASKGSRISPPTTALPSFSVFRRHASSPTPSRHARRQGAANHTSPCPRVRVRAFSTTSPTALKWSPEKGPRSSERNPRFSARSPRSSSRHPRDEDIPYRFVQIIGPQGELSAPQRLSAALAALPPDHSLVMIAPPKSPPPPSQSQSQSESESESESAAAADEESESAPAPGPSILQPPAAVCRIVDKATEAAEAEAAAAAAAAEEEEAKRLAKITKTLELNWAIAPHDLGHKLKRFEEFLGKGLRVDLMLARKTGARKATPEEAQELVRRIREAAANVPGAGEHKKMNGIAGKVLRMFFEGPKDKLKVKV
ncbi:hypothetical protein F4859DRAFT_460343 [Xylaria cf. heliscus]|nr:hypothetical protein F4859DRAFT_460343 [Xylaria cf. heliscus]